MFLLFILVFIFHFITYHQLYFLTHLLWQCVWSLRWLDCCGTVSHIYDWKGLCGASEGRIGLLKARPVPLSTWCMHNFGNRSWLVGGKALLPSVALHDGTDSSRDSYHIIIQTLMTQRHYGNWQIGLSCRQDACKCRNRQESALEESRNWREMSWRTGWIRITLAILTFHLNGISSKCSLWPNTCKTINIPASCTQWV